MSGSVVVVICSVGSTKSCDKVACVSNDCSCVGSLAPLEAETNSLVGVAFEASNPSENRTKSEMTSVRSLER